MPWQSGPLRRSDTLPCAISSGSVGLWRPPLALGFLWGFAEATLFFVIPDVIIGWAALSGWRSGLRMLVAALSGAIVGGLALYAVAVAHPRAVLTAVGAVPFLHPAMIERVAHDYQWQGPMAILFGPGNGVPYKVYAALAPTVVERLSFALLTVPARLERFLPAWLVFALVGRVFHRWIPAHPRGTAVIFAAARAVGYAVYWSLI